jgi:hypothetical protein
MFRVGFTSPFTNVPYAFLLSFQGFQGFIPGIIDP